MIKGIGDAHKENIIKKRRIAQSEGPVAPIPDQGHHEDPNGIEAEDPVRPEPEFPSARLPFPAQFNDQKQKTKTKEDLTDEDRKTQERQLNKSLSEKLAEYAIKKAGA